MNKRAAIPSSRQLSLPLKARFLGPFEGTISEVGERRETCSSASSESSSKESISTMRMIDLFCGAGGLSLGLHNAGFRSVLAVEVMRDACETYSRIFPDVNLLDTTIEDVDFRQYAGQVELLAGGPPCQPFSNGGKRLAHEDVRDMLPQYFRALSEIKPPVFLMENVAGLASGAREGYLRSFLEEATAMGYVVTYQVLNSADYGVPQKRRRLFIVGSLMGPFKFPDPSHGPRAGRSYEVAGKFLSRTKVVGEPNPSIVTYAKNPDLRPSPYDGHLFNGGGRAINLNDVCPTILASAGGNKTHFIDTLDEVPGYHAHLLSGGAPRAGVLTGGRRLTVAESAIMQTFPPDVQFFGARSSRYTQVGNAVPPLLAQKLGIELSALLGTLTPQPLLR